MSYVNFSPERTRATTVRLLYPQWQGGVISHWIPEIPNPNDVSLGYHLGAELLDVLAPKTDHKTVRVPISTDVSRRAVVDGVMDRDILVEQTKAALNVLRIESPDKVVTLGGECSVSVAPFTYLASRYPDDVAVIWIDSHPDITLPGDVYVGYHAMAVTALMGKGDAKIIGELPAKIAPQNILLVGIRNWERNEIKERQKAYGIAHLTPEDVSYGSNPVLEWLKGTRASKVVVHLDLDVLDPQEIIAAVGTDPDGLQMSDVTRIINDVAHEKEVVGLTIAEHMPRTCIRLRTLLSHLPLLNGK